MILGQPLIGTANALINCMTWVMKISFKNMTTELNIFDINKQPLEYDQLGNVCLIKEWRFNEETVDESRMEDPLGDMLCSVWRVFGFG